MNEQGERQKHSDCGRHGSGELNNPCRNQRAVRSSQFSVHFLRLQKVEANAKMALSVEKFWVFAISSCDWKNVFFESFPITFNKVYL